MAISELQPSSGVEELPRGDLRKMMKQQPMPIIDLGDLSPSSISNDEASGIARSALARFSTALVSNDKEALISCFFDEQAYWRDHLALTYHLRTFHGAEVISDALLETKELRNVMGSFNLVGQAHYIKPMPVLVRSICVEPHLLTIEQFANSENSSSLTVASNFVLNRRVLRATEP